MNANVETFLKLATLATTSGRRIESRPMVLRLHRVLGLLQDAGKEGINAHKMASQCEVTARTIYSDIETLRSMGLEIRSQADGWPVDGFALATKN